GEAPNFLAGAIDDAAEFEPAQRSLFYARAALNVIEHANCGRAIQLHSKLRAFACDGCEARMLGDYDFVAPTKKRRIDPLIGPSVLEQRGDMNPGFMGKNIGADDGFGASDVPPRSA